MNLCRTCRWWSLNGNFIGQGVCTSPSAHLMIGPQDNPIVTAQNFGCVCHQSGESTSNIHSPEERQAILNDFLQAAKSP